MLHAGLTGSGYNSCNCSRTDRPSFGGQQAGTPHCSGQMLLRKAVRGQHGLPQRAMPSRLWLYMNLHALLSSPGGWCSGCRSAGAHAVHSSLWQTHLENPEGLRDRDLLEVDLLPSGGGCNSLGLPLPILLFVFLLLRAVAGPCAAGRVLAGSHPILGCASRAGAAALLAGGTIDAGPIGVQAMTDTC